MEEIGPKGPFTRCVSDNVKNYHRTHCLHQENVVADTVAPYEWALMLYGEITH